MRLSRRPLSTLVVFRLAGELAVAAGLLLAWSLPVLAFVLVPPLPAVLLALIPALLLHAVHLRRRPRTRPSRLLAAARPRPLRGIAAPTLAAALAMGAAGVLWAVLWRRWFPGFHDGGSDPILEYARRPGGIAAVLVTALLTGPLLEEVAFRGWVQRAFERRVGAAGAVALAALLFAAFHLRPWRVPYYFAVGAAFGAGAVLGRSIWVPFLMHAAFNAALFAADRLLPGSGTLDGRLLVGWSTAAITAVLIPLVLALAACLVWLGRAARRFRTARAADPPPPMEASALLRPAPERPTLTARST